MKCKIDNCINDVFSSGYCGKHYARYKKYGDPLFLKNERHGKSSSREYSSWHSMIQRCTNKNDIQYKNYGARGITIFSPWVKSFSIFFRDMGERPPNTSLNRIDNNGNYEPGNCEWSTYIQQNNNQRKRKNNTSGHTGVSWYAPSKKWRASITINSKAYNLGHFSNIDDAIIAYKSAKNKKHI